MNELTKKLVEAVKNDLTPSLGVTEPGAIAYAAAAAARALGGGIRSVRVKLNSCIYKNSFTCAVPGTDGMGCALAAALGAVMGDPGRKLMATEEATPEDIEKANALVRGGRATAELADISPKVFIEATVETENGYATAVIEGRHDVLVRISVNGRDVFIKDAAGEGPERFRVSSVSFSDLLEAVGEAEGLEFFDGAISMNMRLYEEGLKNGLMPLTEARCPEGASAAETAEWIACGAIEARVRGAAAPAMALTGSGSHGILATLPVYAAAQAHNAGEVLLRRALLLSALVTTYIKELSGLLSTACGCVLAGGTGAALGISYVMAMTRDRRPDENELYAILFRALNSMAASVTGMICHGGNTGCSLKAAIGVKMAFASAEMAVKGAGAESVHGILGFTPEETMRNMGRIASDMLPVERSILDIMNCKSDGCLI